MPNLPEILSYLIPRIHQLGQYAIDQQSQITGDLKQDGSLVTKVDKHIEQELTQFILKKYPTSTFINEEGTTNPNNTENSELTWIIDPIDGTRNYVHQFPIFCISVALAINEEIQLGIIYLPKLNETYTAIHNQGAFLNAEPIKVTTDPSPLKPICFGQAYWNPNDNKAEKIIKNIANPKRITGAACFNLCMVAKGATKAAAHKNTKIWDVAAGSIIVKEAGGITTYHDGEAINIYETKASFISSNNQQTHNLLIDTLKNI